MTHWLIPKRLTREGFRPFGDVLEIEAAPRNIINQGYAERYGPLAAIDVAAESGHVQVGIVMASPRPLPIALGLMERHPLGSQIFQPLEDRPWLVVVCTEPREPESYQVFAVSGRQGVNYARGTWHHPLLALAETSRFLVIDRAGPGNNLEEVAVAADLRIKL